MAINGNDLCSKVELIFSASDPLCVVFGTLLNTTSAQQQHNNYQTNNNNNKLNEIDRTETIQNCLNPQWNKKIRLNYYFEAKQPLRFEIYDVDSASQILSHHDFLGRCECQLADIVAAPNATLTLPLTGVSRAKGHLTIRADEVDDGQKESLFIVCHGRSLDRKDFFGKSDPFLEFYRLLPIGIDNITNFGGRQMVHRTEFIKKTLNPEWKPFEVTVRHLCEGDKDREFLIECYDYNKNGSLRHSLIGTCRTTVNALASRRIVDLKLINDKKLKKKGSKYKCSGTLHFLDVQLRREHSFLEFISAGLQLEFAVAIDLTASNGNPHSVSSLHYIDLHYPNQYQSAIRAVLDICQHYNQSKNFDALGFGAKIPPNGVVSHIFPLDLINFTRSAYGVDGVLNIYREALSKVTLYGPTNFSPIINDFAHKARQFHKDASRYQILLIITDGIITDMEKTKAAIIAASDLPLSIIIVGVGNEDFDKMNELDSDEHLLTYNGRTAVRDIVQFVPFRNFLGAISNTSNYSPADQSYVQSQLAKEVLAEVPDQITGYMKAHGIAPLPLLNQPPLGDMTNPANIHQYPHLNPPLKNPNENLLFEQPNPNLNENSFQLSTAPPYPY